MANSTVLNVLLRVYDQCRNRGVPFFGPYSKLNAVMWRILKAAQWSFMESSGTLVSVEAYNTGTVSVTNGSADITGDTTVWTDAMTGRKICIDGGTVEYTFTYVNGTSGTLDRNYEGETGSGLAYIIAQDVYPLASDFGEMLVLRDASNNKFLPEWMPEQHEEYYQALSASGVPEQYALFGEDSNGCQQLRFWPAPGSAISYSYRYIKSPTVITAEDDTLDTPSKYDHVVEAMLLAQFTQNPLDKAVAEDCLTMMVRDNIRHARSYIEKTVPNAGYAIGLGQTPRTLTGPD